MMKIEFLNSIMKSFNYNSKEHLSTVITSLNVISIILCDEDFELTYFYNSYFLPIWIYPYNYYFSNHKILKKYLASQLFKNINTIQKTIQNNRFSDQLF